MPAALILDCEGVRPTADERALFRDADPWGFILFARHCQSAEDVRALCGALRETVGRDAPVFIDQEGGRVARMKAPAFPAHPPMAVFGALWRVNPSEAIAAARLNAFLLGRLISDLGGVSAYNSADEARVLETKALDLDPDVIVVGYFLNDPQMAPVQPLQRWFRQPAPWERSHLLRLVDAWRFSRAKARHGNDGYRYLHDPDGDEWKMVLAAFESMHRTASARGVPVVIATLPAFPPGADWTTYPWSDLHEQVITAARARGLAAFDTLPEFAADGRRPKDLCVDFEHPNAAGAELIARAVAKELRALRMGTAEGGPR